MANRVTAAEVREVIDSPLASIDVFIATANMIVTSYLGSKGLSDATLKEIERYVAAHLLSNMDPQVKQTSIGGEISEQYTGEFKMCLTSTTHGQTAIMLDTSGTLGQLSSTGFKKPAVGFGVIGWHE